MFPSAMAFLSSVYSFAFFFYFVFGFLNFDTFLGTHVHSIRKRPQ